MNKEVMTDALLREFLLGKLHDNERDRIESLFLTDADVREQLLVVEQELIEDYLEDSLTGDDRERFLARFAKTEEQRQQLRITRAIIDHATASSLAKSASTSTSLWSRLSKSYFKPVIFVPVAALIVVAFIVAIVWRNGSEEKRRHLAIEQQLAQLNSPASLREVPGDLATLELRPGTLRGAEAQAELKRSSESKVFELRLPWIQKEVSENYQAELRRVGGDETFSIPIHAPNVSDRTIRLRLPSTLLTRGDYIVRLTSVAPDGTTGFSEEYNFSVRDN